jgi:hypothetical protein
MNNRTDLPKDHAEWQAQLEAKNQESLQLAISVLKRVPQIVGEFAPVQVQRTFAGIINGYKYRKRRNSGNIFLHMLPELAKQSARTFGLFEPDECVLIAQAIIDEIASNNELHNLLKYERYEND